MPSRRVYYCVISDPDCVELKQNIASLLCWLAQHYHILGLFQEVAIEVQVYKVFKLKLSTLTL